MPAFQASDESSILSARTIDEPLEMSELFLAFFCYNYPYELFAKIYSHDISKTNRSWC
jgi:hypothetical protein